MRTEPDKGAEWTSLEIAKLLVPIVASIILAYVGLLISEQLETFKSDADRNAKSVDSLVQKRLALYDDIGRKLNQMFAYYMYVGKWKELSPEDIVRDKRELDEVIYTYEPFFSADFVDAYKNLESQMFRPFNGWGKDARLRSEVTRRQEFYLPADARKTWEPAWNDRFTGENNTDAIRQSYSQLMSALPQELGIAADLSRQPARLISKDQVSEPHLPPKN